MRAYLALTTLLLAISCGSVTPLPVDGGGGGGGGGGGSSGGRQTCDQIQATYKAAVTAARACTVGATNQCQKTVPNALGCNGCPTFVNDDSALSQYDNSWNQAGCNQNQVCTNIACLAPQSATCKAADAGGGTCVDSALATPAN